MTRFIKYSFFYIGFLVFLFIGLNASAQSYKKWLKAADQAFESGDFYGAGMYYHNALKVDSSDVNVSMQYALSLKNYNLYRLAERAFEKVTFMEGGEMSHEALYWMAVMQKNQGKYEAAQGNFRLFTNKTKNRSSVMAKHAKHEIKSCSYALKNYSDTVAVSILNLGEQVNSEGSEFGVSGFGENNWLLSVLKADSLGPNREVKDKVYKARVHELLKDGNQWKLGSPLDTNVNKSQLHSANGTLSTDGKRFYFPLCNDKFECGIWMAEVDSGIIKNSQPIDVLNVHGHTITHPQHVEINGREYLFYSSNIPKGKGNMDIWFSTITEKKGKTIYSKPKKPGNKINTPGREVTPFYSAAEKALYFSSDWHYGYGGLDIFKTTGGGTSFGPPHNIGRPFNTPENDLYFIKIDTMLSGFLTSNRPGGFSSEEGTCCNDVYQFFEPVLKEEEDTFVIPKREYSSLDELNKYLPVTLYFHNDEPDPKTRDTLTSLNYMKTYNDYMELQDKYRKEYSHGMEGDFKDKAIHDIDDFFMTYVEKGVEDLELFSELLLEELEKGQKIEITVKGYASPLAKTDYNVNLTLRRISSMQNFLANYQEKEYVPYLEGKAENGGKLRIAKIPFGEYKADQTVSDNLYDQRNSVYSRRAALERKIEIISVAKMVKDSTYAIASFNKQSHDFGKSYVGDTLNYTFTIMNNGDHDLLIHHVKPSCGCTVVDWSKDPIPPGQSTGIPVEFVPGYKTGMNHKSITVYTNGVPAEKQLIITTEVFKRK